MALPKIDLPIYEAKLPSTGEVVKYRAFTVKEEKIMLIAKEANDIQQIIIAIKQILNNCVLNKTIDELAVFDVEYLLTMIRSKSVNNVVDFSILDPETQDEVKLSLDIEQMTVFRDDRHTNKIRINDEYVMFMKYPSYETYLSTFKDQSQEDPMVYYDVMISCIDKIVSEDTVYNLSEFTREEIDQFIEGLSADVVEKIQTFFETMPKLRHEIKYKNSKGNEKTFVIEGTESFFM